MKTAIGVFARAPIAGSTKTRLIPALGPEGAARAHRAFLDDVLRRASPLAPLTLFVAGSAEHPAIAAARGEHALATVPQCAGDLGARMASALETLLRTADRAILVGSDSPTLPARVIRAALHHEADVVLSPSADGGYVLVGGSRVPVFEGVRWSRRTTLAETLARNPGAALTEPWYDVDEPEDLELLRTHLALDPASAPASARLLLDR